MVDASRPWTFGRAGHSTLATPLILRPTAAHLHVQHEYCPWWTSRKATRDAARTGTPSSSLPVITVLDPPSPDASSASRWSSTTRAHRRGGSVGDAGRSPSPRRKPDHDRGVRRPNRQATRSGPAEAAAAWRSTANLTSTTTPRSCYERFRALLTSVDLVESSAFEEHAQSVVLAVGEAAGAAAVELDESVDGSVPPLEVRRWWSRPGTLLATLIHALSFGLPPAPSGDRRDDSICTLGLFRLLLATARRSAPGCGPLECI